MADKRPTTLLEFAIAASIAVVLCCRSCSSPSPKYSRRILPRSAKRRQSACKPARGQALKTFERAIVRRRGPTAL
jgi:hypothetical protein